MKNLYSIQLLLFWLFFMPTISSAQDINFPDANFKQALLDNGNVDSNGDGEISIAEANAFEQTLIINNKGITDLTGIEYFTSITSLQCSENLLTSLDVSNNLMLTMLICSSNQLQAIDVSLNSSLLYFDCSDNDLADIQLGDNASISPLFCDQNRLTFTGLYAIKVAYSSFFYQSDKEIFRPQNELINYELDWSSDYIFEGYETTFTWFNEATDLEVDADWIEDLGNGQFRFLKEGTFYCELTNDYFAATVLTSSVITIEQGLTVTFLDWDGTVLKTEQVIYGGSATAPSEPVRNGYTFTGWDRPFDNVTDNITVRAEYAINQYSVTFIDNDGLTVLKTELVNHGNSATAPSVPEHTGYVFSGWDVPFNNITSNLTVTARYSTIQYTVTYRNMDGATNATGNPDTYTVEMSEITLETPNRPHYIFDGWFDDEQLTQQITTIAGGDIGDITIWAKWLLATDVIKTQKKEFEVYPVPFGDELYISGYEGIYSSGTIYSLTGRIVKQFELSDASKTIKVSDLTIGVYLLQLSGKEDYIMKIIKR
jgi:uncharacterized repeat protein (TIGR02543 family)